MDERKVGVFLNYLNILLRIFSQFWVTPIILGTLGKSEFGLISMSGSILILLPLLDFGMTASITRFASEYRAKEDLEGLRNFLGICQKFLYGTALLSAICCSILYFFLEDIFPLLSEGELYKIKVMFIMLATGSTINFTLCLYTNVLHAFQKFLFTNILVTFSIILTAVGSVMFVLNGYGAIGITLVGLILQVLSIFPARFYCWKKLNLKPNLRYWNAEILKKTLNYSTWIFIGTVSSLIGENMVPLLVGSACGPVEVTYLKLGTVVTGYFLSGSVIAHVFFPQVVKMVTHQASNAELTKLLIKVGKLEFLAGILLVGGFYILGREFFYLWQGEGYERAWHVGMVTSFFIPIAASMGIAWQVLYAKNLLKFRVLISCLCNIIGTVLGYYLTLQVGMFGLLWARFAFPGFLLVIISFIYFQKIAGLNMGEFIRRAYPRSLLSIAFAAPIVVVYLHFYPILNWFDFIVSGCLYVILYGLSSWLFVLNHDEKKIAHNLLAKIFRKS